MNFAAILICAASSAATPQPLSDAAHAIQVGRYVQARMMIGEAIQGGASGDRVERLVADLAFAENRNDVAFAQYEDLLSRHPDDTPMLENAAVAALRIGDLTAASKLLDRATALPTASWRAWDASGVAADRRRDWRLADLAYARAAKLAPGNAEVMNNRGWSLFLRGDWGAALEQIRNAQQLDPKSERIANNLELVEAALSDELPSRKAGESDSDWAARLNDAGIIARASGNSARAIAAFTQAIEARSKWFGRAANNLAMTQAMP